MSTDGNDEQGPVGEPTMRAQAPSTRLGPLAKWGPLGAIVTVLAVVVGVLVSTSPSTEVDAAGTTASTVPGGRRLAEGVVPFVVAEARGDLDEIDWGPRCDTERGTLALPIRPPAECFAPYDGPPGGATETGVTEDEIRVVVYTPMENDPVLEFVYAQVNNDDTSTQTFETYQGYNEILATYMETYGRTLELVRYTGTGPITDAVAATADAETIARDLQPFVVLGGPIMTEAFAETLAANGVMCVACTPGQTDEWYAERGPYVWDVLKNADQYTRMAAEYVGKRLAGGTAEFGGDEVADQPRRFGLIYLSLGKHAETLRERLQRTLADDYGIELVDVAAFSNPVSLGAEAREIMARMKSKGVTTILYTGDPLAPQALTRNATAQDYYPEWVITGSALVDTTIFARTYDQAQWQHAFGVSNLFARVSPSVAGAAFVYRWFHGEPPPARTSAPLILPNLQFVYQVLQGVGPELTHEAFRDTVFTAPVIEGDVISPQISWGERGFWPSVDYAGVDDQTEVFWDPEATGEDETGTVGKGMWAYVDGGRRFLPGEWPEEPSGAFDRDGAVTMYTELPEGVERPSYEPLRP
jgi:hypothetical protein